MTRAFVLALPTLLLTACGTDPLQCGSTHAFVSGTVEGAAEVWATADDGSQVTAEMSEDGLSYELNLEGGSTWTIRAALTDDTTDCLYADEATGTEEAVWALEACEEVTQDFTVAPCD